MKRWVCTRTKRKSSTADSVGVMQEDEEMGLRKLLLSGFPQTSGKLLGPWLRRGISVLSWVGVTRGNKGPFHTGYTLPEKDGSLSSVSGKGILSLCMLAWRIWWIHIRRGVACFFILFFVLLAQSSRRMALPYLVPACADNLVDEPQVRCHSKPQPVHKHTRVP